MTDEVVVWMTDEALSAAVSCLCLRIRIVKTPAASNSSLTRLDRFQPGFQYEVDSRLGLLLFLEGWAEPGVSEEPALVVPPGEMEHDALDNAIAADMAFDDAIAAAIERRYLSGRRHIGTVT